MSCLNCGLNIDPRWNETACPYCQTPRDSSALALGELPQEQYERFNHELLLSFGASLKDTPARRIFKLGGGLHRDTEDIDRHLTLGEVRLMAERRATARLTPELTEKDLLTRLAIAERHLARMEHSLKGCLYPPLHPHHLATCYRQTRQVREYLLNLPPRLFEGNVCAHCEGSGEPTFPADLLCPACHGRGWTEDKETEPERSEA